MTYAIFVYLKIFMVKLFAFKFFWVEMSFIQNFSDDSKQEFYNF